MFRHPHQTVIDLIKKAMKNQDCTTENALAVKIGMERQYISRFRMGTKPSNEKLLALCEAAGEDFATTLTAVEKDFATTEEQKNRWGNYMKRLGGVAASFMAGIFLLVTLIVTSPDLQAKESMTYSAEMSVIQIMRDLAA